MIMSTNLQNIADFLNNKNITNRDALIVAIIVLILPVLYKFIIAGVKKIFGFCVSIIKGLILKIKENAEYKDRLKSGTINMGDLMRLEQKQKKGKKLNQLERTNYDAGMKALSRNRQEMMEKAQAFGDEAIRMLNLAVSQYPYNNSKK